MAQGTGFGKTILIGDQFVLDEVPAIVSAISYETVTTVERIDGEGWVLEDNRIEVPGYKEKKKEQQVGSINRILEVMNFDVKKNPIKITVGGTLLAGSGVGASAASCVSLARAIERRNSSWVFRSRRSTALPGRENSPITGLPAGWTILPPPMAG